MLHLPLHYHYVWDSKHSLADASCQDMMRDDRLFNSSTTCVQMVGTDVEGFSNASCTVWQTFIDGIYLVQPAYYLMYTLYITHVLVPTIDNSVCPTCPVGTHYEHAASRKSITPYQTMSSAGNAVSTGDCLSGDLHSLRKLLIRSEASSRLKLKVQLSFIQLGRTYPTILHESEP